ncbi:MAG: hypothetical protein OIF40_01590 [Mangrovicoccus sp.]|nr:hypothetical protein [Mangrovicoccus sp.]
MTEFTFFHTSFGMELPAIWDHPEDADTLLVLGHGSASTMTTPLMVALSAALARCRIATLRFEYPYSADPSFKPFTDAPVDDADTLKDTLRSALNYAVQAHPDLTALIGGHSLSGLMTTYADAQEPLWAKGIICLGFPHRGDPARTAHLDRCSQPILFVQGSQDSLAPKAEITEICRSLPEDRAFAAWIEDASHGFAAEGRSLDEVSREIAQHIRNFANHL